MRTLASHAQFLRSLALGRGKSAIARSWAGAIVGLALLCSATSVKADVLLSLDATTNDAGMSYDVAFLATQATTTIQFSGYQKYSFEYVTDISVSLNGGANLLGGAWDLTAAALGSFAGTMYDGSSVPGLWFGGYVPGEFDTFSQTLVTTPGAQYDVAFTFYNPSAPPPVAQTLFRSFEAVPPSSQFLVSTPTGQLISVPVTPSVPEPSTWAMMLIGLAGLGFAGYRRRQRSLRRAPL